MDVKKRVTVRCLGPGEEHVFLSANPKTERVCQTCRKKMASQRFHDQILDPVKVPDNWSKEHA